MSSWGSRTFSTSSANSRNRGSFIAALIAVQAFSAVSTSRRRERRCGFRRISLSPVELPERKCKSESFQGLE